MPQLDALIADHAAKPVLNDLPFSAARGAFVSPVGSGKRTILPTLGGRLRRTRGESHRDEHPSHCYKASDSASGRQHLAIVFLQYDRVQTTTEPRKAPVTPPQLFDVPREIRTRYRSRFTRPPSSRSSAHGYA